MLRGQGQLSAQRIRQLDDLGFAWDPYRREREADWESCLLQLAEFHRDHGDCRVPSKQTSFEWLYPWLNRQRELRE
jgi:Helicase associated domain